MAIERLDSQRKHACFSKKRLNAFAKRRDIAAEELLKKAQRDLEKMMKSNEESELEK